MKKYTYLMFTIAATLFTLVATSVSVGACIWGHHQPEEPSILG